jgi:hypothetical protein
MDNLRKLGNQLYISLEPDGDGYTGRECPVEECLGYFKVTPRTGIKDSAPCCCPYCGHCGDNRTFSTRDQIKYAESVALRQVTDAIHKDLKSLEFDHKPQGAFGIEFSLKVTNSGSLPIRYYREKQLETEVVCDNCTLRYAIYGVFGWCPDCGTHNSLQILSKNLELAKSELILAETVRKELAEHLIGDALENVVSGFDGFGREACLRRGADIRFQNIPTARRKVQEGQEAFGIDFADALGVGEWEHVCRIFQKRHLLAHKMGVIDQEYVRNTNDLTAVIGRKIRISQEEVMSAITIVEALGRRLFSGARTIT